jgi:hypothetical protein
MIAQKSGEEEEYLHYAEHCLDVVRSALNRESRIMQREMAAEWIKLADMFSAKQQQAK